LATLYHYTSKEGLAGILKSEQILPSLKENNPKDARYGDGQYLSDIAPGTKTSAELSRHFLTIPWQGKRFTHYVEIDVIGLEIIKGRDGVYVVSNTEPLNISNRIISQGAVQSA
jgi:hypothetical protein